MGGAPPSSAGVLKRALKTPFALHVLFASGQIFVLTVICASCGVFAEPMRSRQFPGHLGPSMFIASIGVAAFVTDWHWRRRCKYEGRLSVAAAVVYVTGETLQAGLTKGRVLSFYVKHGLHAWMAAVVGVCGVVLLEAAPKFKAAPHVWFAAAWSFFIYNHKQPNDFGILMHWAATAWILVGAALRVLNEDAASGTAYVLAAYTFFGGQLGLTLAAEANRANVGSYVLAWHVLPIAVIIGYIRLFGPSSRGTPAAGAATTAADIEQQNAEQRTRLLLFKEEEPPL